MCVVVCIRWSRYNLPLGCVPHPPPPLLHHLVILFSYLACMHYLVVWLFHAYLKWNSDIKHHKTENIIQLTLNKLLGNVQKNKNKTLVVINLCVCHLVLVCSSQTKLFILIFGYFLIVKCWSLLKLLKCLSLSRCLQHSSQLMDLMGEYLKWPLNNNEINTCATCIKVLILLSKLIIIIIIIIMGKWTAIWTMFFKLRTFLFFNWDIHSF